MQNKTRNIYTTIQKFGVGKIFFMFLKDASYAHHTFDQIYAICYMQKTVIVKY